MESVKNIKKTVWSLEKISKQVLDLSMVPEFIKDKKKDKSKHVARIQTLLGLE